MGCASAPKTPAIDDETEQSLTLGIAQVRGTPNHFLVCADCPAPTLKTGLRKTTSRSMTPPVVKHQRVQHKLVVHFDHASSLLKDSDRDALARFVNALPASCRLTVTGYTDNATAGGTIANETLAQQRAQSVRNYLSGLGVDKNDVTLKVSPFCCYVASNTTESGRAKNRRAEIIVTSLSTSLIEEEGINP